MRHFSVIKLQNLRIMQKYCLYISLLMSRLSESTDLFLGFFFRAVGKCYTESRVTVVKTEHNILQDQCNQFHYENLMNYEIRLFHHQYSVD